MKKLSAALLIYLGLASAALAQTAFTMPPPGGVTVVGVQVVTTCGAASGLVNNGIAYLAMNTSGQLCTNASGGGGGAATIADGADVTQGAIADAASTAGGTGTLSAKLRLMTTQLGTINTTLGSPFQAGGALAANQSVNVAQFGGVSTSTGQVAVSVAPVTATNTALVVDLRPDSPGIVTLGQTTKSASIPVAIASDQLGAAADTASMPVVLSPSGNATAGITPVVGGSAVSSLVLKASAGSLYAAYANCTSACWLMIFNSVSAPSNGATTAGVASGNMVECIPIGAGSVGGVNYAPGPPAVYSVGMTAAISSTACTTLTLSTVAMI